MASRRGLVLLWAAALECSAACDTERGATTGAPFAYGWTRTWGSGRHDAACSLARSELGVHVAGVSLGSDAEPNAEWLTREGNEQTALATFDEEGSWLRGVRLEGTNRETRPAVAAAHDGAVYIAALGAVVELPTTAPEPRRVEQLGYVLRFEPGGEQAWKYTWQVAASSVELGAQPSIAVTSDGDVVMSAVRTEIPVADVVRLRAIDGSEVWRAQAPASLRAVAAGGDAIYLYGVARELNAARAWLRRLNAADGGERWTRQWGDNRTEYGVNSPAGGPQPAAGMAILEDGGVVVASSFVSLASESAFDDNGTLEPLPAYGGTDAFVAAFASDGTPRWARAWGGAWNDGASSVAIGDDGAIYVAGWYQGTATLPNAESIAGTGLEALVVALGADGQYRGARSLGGTGADLASGVAVLPDGDLLLSGSFEGRVDFGVGREVDARSAAGFSDAFLTRFRFSDERRAANPQNPSPAACDFRSEALPTSYEQCLAAGGQAIVGPSEATCLRSWCQPSSEFDTCRALGGGLSSADGVQQQPCCKIVYRQGGCPCLGNACD